MLGFKIFLLLVCHSLFVECFIQSLTVRKLDTKLIQRKRQDNYEMCRIFNAENEKLRQNARSNFNNQRHNPKRFKRNIETTTIDSGVPKHRVKRAIDGSKYTGAVPTLREEDAERVENIVDKLYDDLTEHGRPVEYRHRPLGSTVKPNEQNAFNHSGRRFDFAPAELLGPLPEGGKFSPPETVPGIKWVKKWKHGIIPYFIDPKTYDSQLADTIMNAFDYFEKATCIRLQRLREKPIDKMSMQNVEWIYISNPSGIRQCVHSNEKLQNRGVQMVVLGYDCLSVGGIVHEVMHVLGFSHEHTRPDRSQHLTVFWDNIKPGYMKYFQTRGEDPLMGLPYDYASVLHYPPRAFSKNGKVTLFAKNGIKLGQRDGLSDIDVEKVNLVFGNECVDRNKEYLLTTCPSVVKRQPQQKTATQEEITQYFSSRIWPFAVVNYRLKDDVEFSAEEKENIQAVIKHIEKETCIVFKEASQDKEDANDTDTDDDDDDDGGNDIDGVIVMSNTDKPGDNFDVVSSDERIHKGDKQLLIQHKTPKNRTEEKLVHMDFKGQDPKDQDVLFGRKSTNEAVSVTVDGTLKRAKRAATRRHADGILTLTRSSKPGCKCPKPGKPNANTDIELGMDCFNSVNDLLHVFVHLLGLDHQHNMHDRDEFLHIVWGKLSRELQEEMHEKLPPAAAVGFNYDYQSVMHYPWLQIKNGVTNIMYPIWNDGWAMGHWQGLSSTDIQKLNLLYFEQCLERKKLES